MKQSLKPYSLPPSYLVVFVVWNPKHEFVVGDRNPHKSALAGDFQRGEFQSGQFNSLIIDLINRVLCS